MTRRIKSRHGTTGTLYARWPKPDLKDVAKLADDHDASQAAYTLACFRVARRYSAETALEVERLVGSAPAAKE